MAAPASRGHARVYLCFLHQSSQNHNTPHTLLILNLELPHQVPQVPSVAGSVSGGGAGIQANSGAHILNVSACFMVSDASFSPQQVPRVLSVAGSNFRRRRRHPGGH